MALSLTLKHSLVAIALLYVATSCCQAQQADPVQIVARAALCFDNHAVINRCLASMGINVNGTANATSKSNTGLGRNITTISAQKNISLPGLCNGPCFGQMMLVTNCIDGILSNFQFYNPGLMRGVQAIFQMSCGQNNNNGTDASSSDGDGSGGSGKLAAASNYKGASNHGNDLAIPIYISLGMPVLLLATSLL